MQTDTSVNASMKPHLAYISLSDPRQVRVKQALYISGKRPYLEAWNEWQVHRRPSGHVDDSVDIGGVDGPAECTVDLSQ